MSTTTSFNTIDKNVSNYEDEHGLTFKILFYIAISVTLFLISYLKPPHIYKKVVSRILNFTFKWRGAYWKVYNLLVIFIILIGLFLFCNINIFNILLIFSFNKSSNSIYRR